MKILKFFVYTAIAIALCASMGCSGRAASNDTETPFGAEPSIDSPLFNPSIGITDDDESGVEATEDDAEDVATEDEVESPLETDEVEIVGADIDTDLMLDEFFGHAFKAIGGSGEYLWNVEGEIPEGMDLYCSDEDAPPCTGWKLYLKGTPKEAGFFDIKVKLEDGNDASNAESIEFQLHVGAPPPGPKPETTSSDCSKPLSIEVEIDSYFEEEGDSITTLISLMEDVQITVKAKRGDGPAAGKTHWSWESRVEDSYRCVVAPGNYPTSYYFTEEGSCPPDVQGRWTRNNSWESLVGVPQVGHATVEGSELPIGGKLKYDGPFNMETLKTDGVDDVYKVPVEVLSISVTDSCSSGSAGPLNIAEKNLRIKIRYPLDEPMKNISASVRYKDKKDSDGNTKMYTMGGNHVGIVDEIGTLKIVFANGDGEKMKSLRRNLKHDGDCADECTKNLSPLSFEEQVGGRLKDVKNVYLVWDLEDQNIQSLPYAESEYDFIDLKSVSLRTKFWASKFMDTDDVFTESGMPSLDTVDPYDGAGALGAAIQEGMGKYVSWISNLEKYDGWEADAKALPFPMSRRAWPDYD